jgi:hypothetical protein
MFLLQYRNVTHQGKAYAAFIYYGKIGDWYWGLVGKSKGKSGLRYLDITNIDMYFNT